MFLSLFLPFLPTDEEENNGGSQDKQDKQVKPKLCSFPSLPDYVLKEEEEENNGDYGGGDKQVKPKPSSQSFLQLVYPSTLLIKMNSSNHVPFLPTDDEEIKEWCK